MSRIGPPPTISNENWGPSSVFYLAPASVTSIFLVCARSALHPHGQNSTGQRSPAA